MCLYSISFNGDNLNMNYLLISCVLFSSFSFLAYSISYFISPHMKTEFERFKLKKIGIVVIILEILGAIGVVVGLFFKPILLISSGGLALLMLLAIIIRIKSKDNFWAFLPAIFYFILNTFIFYLVSKQ